MLAHHTSPQTIRVDNRNIAISYTGIYLAKVCFLPNHKIGFISDKYPCKKNRQGVKMLMYNPEDKTYSKFITIEEMAEVQEKIKQIEERLKNTPVNPPYNFESEGNIDINSVSELKKLIRTDNFNLNASINRRRASLFLVACYFCMEKEPLDFLIAEGSEVNRTDIFGYNAIMSVILNENMEDDIKLQTIQMLINKGVDVNWLNIQGETALTLALERIELDIANLLLDNGAVLYKN